MMSNRPHQAAYYALQGVNGVYECSRVAGQPGQIWIGENPPSGYIPEIERTWQPLSDFEEHLPSEWRNPPEAALRAGHGGGDYFVVKDFVDAALGDRPPVIDVYSACEWTAVGLCSQISVSNGGVPVRIPDFRDPGARPLARGPL
jgi:hypothetical protein